MSQKSKPADRSAVVQRQTIEHWLHDCELRLAGIPSSSFLRCLRNSGVPERYHITWEAMAEGPTRRACNRCHAQKLSCKRNGEEPCERCVRLKTECKSSLSLRFRKNRLSLEKSPQRGVKPSTGRRTAAVTPGCSSSGIGRSRPKYRVDQEPAADHVSQAGDRGRGGGFSHGPGHEHSSPAGAALVAVAGTDAILDNVCFPYSSLQDHFFIPDPSTATILHTIPRVLDDQDLSGLDTPWSPSYQASGPCADWTQSSSASTYDSSTSNYQCTSSPFSCMDPQQLRFKEQTELCDADREEAQQVQQRVPRRILLRRSSIDRMAAQGKWLSQLSDINSALLNLSSLVPYLVESGEDTDVYACQTSSHSSKSSEDSDASRSEQEGFPIQSMFEASGRLVEVLGDITKRESVDVELPVDPGTGLLVLSTYVRLLDLYQKVVRLVHSELAVSSPCCSTFRLCKLPDVSVGSFPVASALSLQMSLTIRLAEDFLSNLRADTALFSQRLPDFASRGQQGGGQASLWSVVDVSFTAIREREQDVSRDLVEIRSKLETSST